MITDEMIQAAHEAYASAPIGLSWAEAMRAALEAAEKAAWRPIEEAPKDGTTILAVRLGFEPSTCEWVNADRFGSDFYVAGKWFVDPELFDSDDDLEAYFKMSDYEPTHYRPLPKGPEE